ncbi:hypothetical protein F0L74_11490 [Chitinophaga agrisoli]|uniref:Damage-inducible protein DinB n=1 Tax=Chitinophaga agrisoli TaxID=2607653 RepID=A0A5B2VV52_9BACT|nr:DinB family protein [Chitinophaga agrisoli]KAA2243131.1 hypothetical protein F0L74_11490 [Chitinophaga agrisoli]
MILQQQYMMVQYSREIVLDFIETTMGKDINTPVPVYNNKTICELLEHNASCYFYWLSYFGLHQPAERLTNEKLTTIPQIRRLYGRVNELVAAFLEKYGEDLDTPITPVPEDWGPGTATPLQAFTQVLTHECHHKGQIVWMCRILGYAPPDTDVRRSFPYEV